MNITKRILSVSEVNELFSSTLKQLGRLAFEGEVSDIKRPTSGHLYFIVKDQHAQVSVVLWKSSASRVNFDLENGLHVQCYGTADLYRVTGRLQVVLDRVVLAGEGALQQKFLELKAKLEREGLFSLERKRPIPFFPRAVGVVTSKSGAVIKDIMVKIHERMPNMQVYLLPVRVQGQGAAQEIARAIEIFNEQNLVDVMIVGRGGGSLEDLWAFNEEVVVRAIFASRIPVVSGVGHEIDLALSDLVADRRAPTPTAAAEMVVPNRSELLKRIAELEQRFIQYERWMQPRVQRVDELTMRFAQRGKSILSNLQLKLEAATSKLTRLEPFRVISVNRAKIDILKSRILAKANRTQLLLENKLSSLHGSLRGYISPDFLKRLAESVSNKELRLKRSFRGRVSLANERLENLERRLISNSPQEVLKRGYSIVRSTTIEPVILKSAGALTEGEKVEIQFAKGYATSQIIKLKK